MTAPPTLMSEIDRALQTALNRAKAIIDADREIVVALAEQLMSERFLKGDKIAAALNEHAAPKLQHRTSDAKGRGTEGQAPARGPLLRPVYGQTVRSRYLDPSFVGATLKRLSKLAKYPEAEVHAVSGHSLRVGAAQTLTIMGCGLLPIMAAGGWRSSNVVARYVEKVEMNVWER
jgi:hypothetical protein